MSKIIWIDLDEVLAELVDYALVYHNYTINGQTIKREHIKDYYIYKIDNLNINLDDGINWFREAMEADEEILQVKPVDWAYKELQKYKSKWYFFKIITARNWDLFSEYTYNWVEKHYPWIFDNVIFANHFSQQEKSKADLCKEQKIYHMVEDNMDYAFELAQNGVKTFLLEKPWNKERKEQHKNLIRVKNWDEIYFE